MRIAAAVALNLEQRQALERVALARSMSTRLVEWARTVVLAADGLESKQIAQQLSGRQQRHERRVKP
jgi:DNA-binding NarL/FixJ family response regulator